MSKNIANSKDAVGTFSLAKFFIQGVEWITADRSRCG